ncbi:uncharacterized protein ARB_04761 [Trichophyton benhamiae CBS 112371]|uniref:Uncharacterized protein n=1 Tax=Arthroderma benhamiae (strain ATCC MYA-4681 / CBS 112371) TaxID=663331 RepID=D4AM71_ARTBC|nr:uncharacterized protein ARB_04761 [Trichophyton benhamiae CBS 112371]EFE35827.1 hypothetical protein ARB_04761 [Trichophyton benhamiae CBS 112371]
MNSISVIVTTLLSLSKADEPQHIYVDMLVTGKRKAKAKNKAQREAETVSGEEKEGFGHGMVWQWQWHMGYIHLEQHCWAGLGWGGRFKLASRSLFCFVTSSCSLLRPD